MWAQLIMFYATILIKLTEKLTFFIEFLKSPEEKGKSEFKKQKA